MYYILFYCFVFKYRNNREIFTQYIWVNKSEKFKNNLRTNEACFWKKLRTNEARSNFTGSYKKKKVYLTNIT